MWYIPIQDTLFPKGECLSTYRVGPLGLNGFLFLGLLVLDFYPPTNGDLYLVGGGEGGRGGAYFFYLSKNFGFLPPYER